MLYLNQVITNNAALKMEAGDKITLVSPSGEQIEIKIDERNNLKYDFKSAGYPEKVTSK